MKPLTSVTQRLLAPIALSSQDRLTISTNDDQSRFICDIYQESVVSSPKIAMRSVEEAGKRIASLSFDDEENEKLLAPLREAFRKTKEGDKDSAREAINSVFGDITDVTAQRHLNTALRVLDEPDVKKTHASWAANREFPKRVPERKKIESFGMNCWEFAATDYTAEIINACWPRDQIIFDDEAAEVMYDYLLLTGKQQDDAAEVYARFKTDKVVPDHDYELHDKYPLAEYQQVALYNSARSEGYGLFMEQGTGKTPVVIARICNMALALREEQDARGESRRMLRVVIVAPKNVRMNWGNEVAKFTTVGGKVTVVRGGAIRRAKQFIDAFTQESDDELFTAVVISYEGLQRAWKMINQVPWDLSVLDESHYIKTPRTQRFKFSMKLRDISTNRMVLTGTPITNTALDLYSQFEFMGRGWSGFNSWHNFRQFYGVYKTTESGHKALVSMQNLPFMQERLARLSFIIRKEEALPDLPDKVYDVCEVEMTGRQKDIYRQLAEQLAVEIESEMSKDGNKSLVVSNILTKLLRLAQITSGFVVWDAKYSDDGEVIEPKTTEDLDSDNPKIQALLDLAKEKDPSQKTIVWACFVHDIKRIKESLEAAGHKVVTYFGGTSDDDRVEAERAFNYDDDCRWFVGNPAAGGTGLNLLGYPPGQEDDYSTNCDHVVYYSQDWSSTKRSQSEDRAHRRGTRQNVRITDLCVPGSIDEEIRTRVVDKRVSALQISDIRHILDNVLKADLDD